MRRIPVTSTRSLGQLLGASYGMFNALSCSLTTDRLIRTDKLEPLGEALPMLEFAAAETRKRAPHLTHPLLCLEAIRVGVEQGGQAGLKQVWGLLISKKTADGPELGLGDAFTCWRN